MRKMSLSDIYLFVYEKVFIGAVIAIVSSLVLYSFNLYSRGFETAQGHTKAASTIASQFRDFVLSRTEEAVITIRSAYTEGDEKLSDKIATVVDSIAANIQNRGRIISAYTENTYSLAMQIAADLEVASSRFTMRIRRTELKDFEEKISLKQAEFLKVSTQELERLSIAEFKEFTTRFESEIPWYMRPQNMFWIVVIAFIAATIGLFFLRRTPEDRSRRRWMR